MTYKNCLFIVSLILAGCGTALPKESDPLQDASRNGAITSDDKNLPGSKNEVNFVVPARPSAVDVVFFVDDDGEHRKNAVIKSRMNDAVEGFVGRLKFTRGDVNLLIGPSSIPATDSDGNSIAAPTMDKGVGFWREADGSNEGISYKSDNLTQFLTQRLFNRNDETYQFSPLSSIKRTIRVANGTAIRSKTIKSFTHIVLVTSRPDKADTTQPQEVIDALNQELSAGWHLTVFSFPKDGCDLGDTNRTIVGQALKADGTASGQEYKGFSLAQLAGARGTFVSLCSPKFNESLQEIAGNPWAQKQLTVELGAKAIAKSIQVKTPKGLVTGWTYKSGETKLSLPTFLLPNTKVTVSYIVHDGKTANPLPTDMVAPPVLDKQLAPEEILFVQKGNPPLQRQCGSCHTNGNLKRFVGNFGNVKASKTSILDRIQRASTAAGVMPPGGAGSAAAIQDINDLKAYLGGI